MIKYYISKLHCVDGSDGYMKRTTTIILGPFDRKRVIGMISGDVHVDAPNYTSVFHTSVVKNACSSPLLCGCYVIYFR